MSGDIEFTDRYRALGIPYPSALTVCRGQCEGTGMVPVYMESSREPHAGECRPVEQEEDPRLAALWQEAEAAHPADDGWHFVRCPDCAATGRQQGWLPWIFLRNLPRVLAGKARFARFHLFSTYSWRRDVPHWRWFNIRIVLRILLRSW
jgi:hypothetical protein